VALEALKPKYQMVSQFVKVHSNFQQILKADLPPFWAGAKAAAEAISEAMITDFMVKSADPE